MSHTPFLENQSADPVEQAIARKVVRILNDTTLDRARGYQARCITVRDGVLHIGASDRRHGFVWL